MKIIINYDFFNAILDVNENLTPMKIVRNNKKYLLAYNSFFIPFDYITTMDIPTTLLLAFLQNSGFFMGFYAYAKYNETDVFKERSKIRLQRLVQQLKDININTDYNLLIQSEYLERKYKIYLNENKIPELMENKYILVPTYNFNNNIKHTTIQQEHVVGSNDYVLSVGSPKKELKLAYSRV